MGLARDPFFVIHSLRHTCASRLARAGVPIVVVKEWLGHKDIQTTLRYVHMDTSALMVGVAALEK